MQLIVENMNWKKIPSVITPKHSVDLSEPIIRNIANLGMHVSPYYRLPRFLASLGIRIRIRTSGEHIASITLYLENKQNI